MTKKTSFVLLVFLMSSCSVFAIFERTKNFFKGLRSYDGYYYDEQGQKHYYNVYYQKPTRHRLIATDEDYLNKTSIIENKNQYVITVLLPGYDKNDIHISALERSIHISASGTKDEQKPLANPPVVTFEETVPLQMPISPHEVQSQYLNGVLTITAPKVTASDKSIEVPIK
jgi:HSP20 family molecular chaperone IbpA